MMERRKEHSSEPAGHFTCALTDTERAVAQIWQRMFGLESVARGDHFFAIGGDSLTAIRMLGEVEGLFDLVLPSSLVFEAPTLESLCGQIDCARKQVGAESTRGFVFPLIPSGTGTPMFFNGVDLILARQGLWTVPCPVFAIANWAAGSGFVNAGSLEALASFYLDGIRRIQRDGPYRLGGFSLGAMIAFEMGRQLETAGEEVELLFMLDPMLPGDVGAHGFGHASPNVKATFDFLFPADRWDAFTIAAQRLMKNYTPKAFQGPALVVFSRERYRADAFVSLLRPNGPRYVLDAGHAALFEPPALGQWMKHLSDCLAPA